MKKYEIAVFDVDGTLLDTTKGIMAAVKFAIDEMGFAPLSDEQILTFIGPPIRDSFARAYNLEGGILQTITDCFRNRYRDYELFNAVPYKGIYRVFDDLFNKGVKLAIATYKRQDLTEALLKHFDFDTYTNILYGADYENKLKKVDIIRKCMDDLGVHDYSNAVMIGDSSHDAIGAKQIGMDFIGVTYGFDFKSQDDVLGCGAIGAADSPEDILKYFTK